MDNDFEKEKETRKKKRKFISFHLCWASENIENEQRNVVGKIADRQP